MNPKLVVRNLIHGFLSWFIPFAASFAFFAPNGELIVSYPVFKTAIMLIGVISGCFLLVRFLSAVEAKFVREAIVVGASWFGINILFDALILIPIMKSTFTVYFTSIGFGYFSIPVISVSMGVLLEKTARERQSSQQGVVAGQK